MEYFILYLSETSSESERPYVPHPPRKRKKKEAVDPNAPKRPANAFMIFQNMERENVLKDREKRKAEGQNVEETTMAKEMGARWKALDSEQRESINPIALT
jgi:hypothetical protein